MLLAEHIKDLTVFWIAGDVLRRGEVGEEPAGRVTRVAATVRLPGLANRSPIP